MTTKSNASGATYGGGSQATSVPEPRRWSPISTLQNFHKTWTLKLVVFRRSDTEQWENSLGSGQVLEIIVMDSEGTAISLCPFQQKN